MSRVRSPNYPQISLPDALDRVRKIHAKENHLAAAPDVIAKHLGYGGLNGTSSKVISAISKYGLLEEANGGKIRVSPLAISIMFPKSDEDKSRAIKTAAYKPALFSEIQTEWEGQQPSDDNLRSFLIHRNFSSDALDRVIQSYRETFELLAREPNGGPKLSPLPPETQVPTIQTSQTTASPQPVVRENSSILSTSEPYRLSMTRGGIDVTAHLTDEESANELIQALEAWKILLKKM
jgi:hypothetical protein